MTTATAWSTSPTNTTWASRPGIIPTRTTQLAVEYRRRARFPSRTGGHGIAVNLAIDWNGDGTINANDAMMARHMMARYLYVLAMMLIDPRLLTARTSRRDPVRRRRRPFYDLDRPRIHYQVQYALAQWAINCVDFRDRDSTMTPFEFDMNPFDGWGVDGVIGTPPTTTTDVVGRAGTWFGAASGRSC